MYIYIYISIYRYIHIYIYIYMFSIWIFFLQTFTNHRTAVERGGHFFNSILPLLSPPS